jgi:hypothetical protein
MSKHRLWPAASQPVHQVEQPTHALPAASREKAPSAGSSRPANAGTNIGQIRIVDNQGIPYSAPTLASANDDPPGPLQLSRIVNEQVRYPISA